MLPLCHHGPLNALDLQMLNYGKQTGDLDILNILQVTHSPKTSHWVFIMYTSSQLNASSSPEVGSSGISSTNGKLIKIFLILNSYIDRHFLEISITHKY